MECFEWEFDRWNYLLSYGCLGNEFIKDKLIFLCEGIEVFYVCEKMIYVFDENNYL